MTEKQHRDIQQHRQIFGARMLSEKAEAADAAAAEAAARAMRAQAVELERQIARKQRERKQLREQIKREQRTTDVAVAAEHELLGERDRLRGREQATELELAWAGQAAELRRAREKERR